MEKTYIIRNLDCAHCGAKIEEAIKKIDGVEDAILNFPLKKFKIAGNITEEILKEINTVANKIESGVIIEAEDKSSKHTEHNHNHECHCGDEHCHSHSEAEHTHSHSDDENSKTEIILSIIGVIAFVSAILIEHFTELKVLSLIIYIISYILLGYNVLIATIKNIRSGNLFDENFLMTIATVGAFILGEYSEAVGVVLFFKIGELFEDYAVKRSRKAITDVTELHIPEADVLRDNDFVRVDTDEIQINDIIRIKTGERIAVDGVIQSGTSKLDTSAINGEPVPVIVKPGDTVMSGCINLADTLTIKASTTASDSIISKIAQAVEDASAAKPNIDRFITRFSKIYTPFVVITAVLTAIIGSLITKDIEKSIYTALTFLVISCPCALVLSVPLAYFSGIGAASKLGILFKGGNALEALGKVKSIIFDKTGTLTDGSFNVTDITVCGNTNEKELLQICGSCEQISTHPVAESITSKCRAENLTLTKLENSTEIAGRGVICKTDGKVIMCGNEKLMAENNITILDMTKVVTGSVVYVAVNNEIIGRIVVSDTIKQSSKETIKEFKSMGIHTVMLTGDKQENAEAVGKELELDLYEGELLPGDKLSKLNSVRSEKGSVMFVGDGINDAPVLAGADVGGAMQSGADLALEAADVVFMNSDPKSILIAKKIADKTLRISYQNIIFALLIKAAVLVFGLIGHPNMWLAVFADSGTAMLLIINSVRILNTKRYKKL